MAFISKQAIMIAYSSTKQNRHSQTQILVLLVPLESIFAFKNNNKFQYVGFRGFMLRNIST